MSQQREYRFTARELKVELRVEPNSSQRVLTGYAAVFNSRSEDLGGWYEQINPGAFSRSLRSNPDVVALSEHDVKKGILGRTKSGTLRLSEDSVGLRFECDLPNTTLGNDIGTSVARGDLDGTSFGFVAQDSSWEERDGVVLRTLKDADLLDVTITAMPAYPATSVQLRSKMFPDGSVEIPVELQKQDPQPEAAKEETRNDLCECDCPECEAGDCPDCSNESCDDPNCEANDNYRNNRLLASVIMRRVRSC